MTEKNSFDTWLEQPIGCSSQLAWSIIMQTLSAAWNGGVILRFMWGWFVAPTIHATQLSFTMAAGVYLVVRHLVTHQPDVNRPGPVVKNIVGSFMWMFLPSTLLFGVAWLFHHGI